MAIRGAPRYLGDTFGKLGIDNAPSILKIYCKDPTIAFDRFTERDDVKLGVVNVAYNEVFDEVVGRCNPQPPRVGSKQNMTGTEFFSGDVDVDSAVSMVKASIELTAGEGAVSERDHRQKIMGSLSKVLPLRRFDSMTYGVGAIAWIYDKGSQSAPGSDNELAKSINLYKSLAVFANPYVTNEEDRDLCWMHQTKDAMNATSQSNSALGWCVQMLRLCRLSKQKCIRNGVAHAKTLKKTDRVLSKPLHPLVRSAIADVDEDNPDLMELLDGLYAGEVPAAALEEMSEKLETEHDELMEGWLTGENIMEMARRTEEIEESTGLLMETIEDYIWASNSTITYMGLSGCIVHATPYGILARDERSGKLVAMSTDDLKEAAEMASESFMCVVAFGGKYGYKAAKSLSQCHRIMFRNLANSNFMEQNDFPCAMREYEANTMGISIGDLLKDGSKPWDVSKSYGYAMSSIIKTVHNFCPGSDPYEWARACRCVGQTRFSNPLVMWQALQVYGPCNPVTDEALERLRWAVRYVIAHSHRRNFGEWPKSLTVGKPNRDFDIEPPSLEECKDWVPAGDAIFDFEATQVRDKRNVPRNKKLHSSARAINEQTAEQKREVLFYEVKSNDWKKTVKRIAREVQNGKFGEPLVGITVKAEQKKEGRQVSMEDNESRRVTGCVNNNAIPLLSSIPGSLLQIGDSQRSVSTDEMVTEMKPRGNRICFNVMTDFKWFGNMMPLDVTRIGYECLAEYYGEAWIGKWCDHLLHQTVFVHHNASYCTFKNVTGTNGQGMENGIWQLILGAMPYATATTLSGQIRGLGPDEVIKLIYFMDDHCFQVPSFVPRKRQTDVLKWATEQAKHISGVLCTSWKPYGLDMRDEKNAASISGLCLLGTTYDENGIRWLATKGVDACIKETAHRAPGLMEQLDGVEASLASSQLKGTPPTALFYTGLAAVARIITRYVPRMSKTVMRNIPPKFFAPRQMGGMGGFLPTTLVGGSTWDRDDERILALYINAGSRTSFWKESTCILMAPREKRAATPRGWASHPKIRRTSLPCAPNSPLLSAVKEALGKRSTKTLKACEAHLEAMCAETVFCFDIVAEKMLKAIVDSHPASVLNSEVNFYTQSSTAALLIGEDKLNVCQKSALRASREYLLAGLPMRNTGMVDVWDDLMERLGYGEEFPAVSGPARCPTSCVSAHINEPYYGDEIVVPVYKTTGFSGTPRHTSGLMSTVPTSHIFLNPRRAAQVTYADLSQALIELDLVSVRGLVDTLSVTWSDTPGVLLSSNDCGGDLFMKLSRLSSAPPLYSPGLTGAGSTFLMDYKALAEYAQRHNLKPNYGVLTASVLLRCDASSSVPSCVIPKDACFHFKEVIRTTADTKLLGRVKELNEGGKLLDLVSQVSKPRVISSYEDGQHESDIRANLEAVDRFFSLTQGGSKFPNIKPLEPNLLVATQIVNPHIPPLHLIIETWTRAIYIRVLNKGHSMYHMLDLAPQKGSSVRVWMDYGRSDEYKLMSPGRSDYTRFEQMVNSHEAQNLMPSFLVARYRKIIGGVPPMSGPSAKDAMYIMVNCVPSFLVSEMRKHKISIKKRINTSHSMAQAAEDLLVFSDKYMASYLFFGMSLKTRPNFDDEGPQNSEIESNSRLKILWSSLLSYDMLMRSYAGMALRASQNATPNEVVLHAVTGIKIVLRRLARKYALAGEGVILSGMVAFCRTLQRNGHAIVAEVCSSAVTMVFQRMCMTACDLGLAPEDYEDAEVGFIKVMTAEEYAKTAPPVIPEPTAAITALEGDYTEFEIAPERLPQVRARSARSINKRSRIISARSTRHHQMSTEEVSVVSRPGRTFDDQSTLSSLSNPSGLNAAAPAFVPAGRPNQNAAVILAAPIAPVRAEIDAQVAEQVPPAPPARRPTVTHSRPRRAIRRVKPVTMNIPGNFPDDMSDVHNG